jgi:hypothetical protein
MKHIACSGIGIVLLLGVAGLPASAQNQTPSTSQNSSSGSSSGSSLGDYARQVRKDPGAPSKPKVFDNDNLPKQDKLSIVGQTLATVSSNSAAKTADSEGAAAATGEAKAGDAKSADDKTGTEAKPATSEKTSLTATAKSPEDPANQEAAAKQWGDKINSQKEQIDLLTRELDVLQREYQIRAAAMYADAGNRMRNSADWDKQDAQYKQQIADKQKVLDDAKQKLDDIQEQARKAGAPVSVREP